MAYQFLLSEPIGIGVRRVGREQIDQAIELLSDPPDPHRSVHEARKCLKRIRAVLRLARPALEPDTFRKENCRFRDIARGLSQARDSQAMLEALDKLGQDAGRKDGGKAFDVVQAWLQSERAKAEQDLDQGALAVAARGLTKSRRRFDALALEHAQEGIFDGMEISYRQGRKRHRLSMRGATGETYHEWRKSVQQHWRQMQLLTPCWPAALEARAACARQMSQILGDEHDLYVLIGRLRRQKDLPARRRDIAALIARCTDREQELRRQAQVLGARLYAERPKAFRERIEVYWRTARDAHEMQLAELDPDPSAGKIVALRPPRKRKTGTG